MCPIVLNNDKNKKNKQMWDVKKKLGESGN
jgi:hypothetical protein